MPRLVPPPAISATNLGTSFAMVRLLSCVHAFVNSQGRSLDKLLATSRIITNMRSEAGVDSFCLVY